MVRKLASRLFKSGCFRPVKSHQLNPSRCPQPSRASVLLFNTKVVIQPFASPKLQAGAQSRFKSTSCKPGCVPPRSSKIVLYFRYTHGYAQGRGQETVYSPLKQRTHAFKYVQKSS